MLVCRLVCSELYLRLIPRQLKVCVAPPHLPQQLRQLLLQLLLQLRLKLLPPRNPATLTQGSTASTRMLALREAHSQRRGGMSHWPTTQSHRVAPAMAHTWDRPMMMITTMMGSRGQHTISLPSVITSLSFAYRIPAGLKPWLAHTCLTLLSQTQGYMLLGSAGQQDAATV